MMVELQLLAPAFAAGLLLGAIFFGGLWWTVRRGLAAPQPALWFFGGLLLRMSIAMCGFYLIGGIEWGRWLMCLAGFVVARFVVHWLTRATPRSLGQEIGNAS
jgi:F1F0 ATPase subunit 2